jgi:BNR repeat-containing family member
MSHALTRTPRLLTWALVLAALAAVLIVVLGGSDSRSRYGVLGSGSWSWFGDPRAVYVGGPHGHGRIFAGWIDPTGEVTIGSYDPRTGRSTSHVVAYATHDDHSAPSLLVEPDRRLTVFWSAHNGARMYIRSTLRPADISQWGPVEYLPSSVEGKLGFTYPNPVLLRGEHDTLYLFWRGADWSAAYATRSADGRWGPAHELIKVGGRHRERPYMKVAADQRQIAFAFTDGHPRTVLTSIYYAAYRDGWLRGADGRPITRMGAGPIAPRRADVVYDARVTRVKSWVWDVALDRQGRPVIVYVTFPSARHQLYWYADWTGTRWVSHFLTVAGGTISPGSIERDYSGGIVLDHSDPSVVYLSREARGGFELERWVTADHGRRWSDTVVVRAAGTDNVRPVVPRDWDRAPMQVLWLRGLYGTYRHYHTSVAYLR